MWTPNAIQVTVQRAKGLLTKGKNGTNNCFVTIGLGKEKYQTSVKEKATESAEWHEECELTIPDQGNRAELVLTVLHRNNLSLDEFLGQVTLPLNEMDVYDRPRSKWYKLESKPGKEKKKERGELEVRISFIVKSGSLSDLSKKEKHKSSIGQLASSVGGSLLSIGALEKRKGIKKFAKSLGSKMHLNGKKKGKDSGDADSYSGSFSSIGTPNSTGGPSRYGQRIGEADPGVISEDEDEFVFDNLSHKSSGSSLNIRAQQNRNPSPLLSKEDAYLRSRTLPPLKPPRNASDQKLDEWETKLYGKHLGIGSTDSLKRRSYEDSRVPLPTSNEAKSDEEKEENTQTEAPRTQTPVEQNSKVANKETTPAPVTPQQKKEPEDEMLDMLSTVKNSTAPNTPVTNKRSEEDLTKFLRSEQKSSTPRNASPVPTPMPRSATMECLADKNTKEFDVKEKTDKKSKFTSKLKYFKREKPDSFEDVSIGHQKVSERIIIGHENNVSRPRHSGPEVSPDLIKKYEGKTREDLMILANGLEKEALMQRQKVNELEDYLDNLLLRVMETHPKILQNPYGTRTTATKSG